MNQLHKLLGLLVSLSMLGSSGGFVSFDTHDDADLNAPVVQENVLQEPETDAGESQDQGEAIVEETEQPAALPPEGDEQEPALDVPEEEPEVVENPATGPPAGEATEEPEIEDVEVPTEGDIDVAEVDETEESGAPAESEAITGNDTFVEEPEVPAESEVATGDDTVVEETEAPAESEADVTEDSDVETSGDPVPENHEEADIPEKTEDVVVEEEPVLQSASLMEAQATNVSFTITVTDNVNVIPGASVVAHNLEQDVTYGSGTTGENGTLTLDLPEQTMVYFTVSKAGFEVSSVDPVPSRWIDAAFPSTSLFLSPIVAGYLTMTIVSGPNSEIAVTGATVQILQNSTFVDNAIETPAGSGTYVSSKQLAGGVYEVVMSHPNYVAQPEWVDVQGPTSDFMYAVEIVSGDITIQVKNRDTGALIPNATITVDPDSTAPVTMTTGQNGTATFANLAGGGHTAAITADGFQSLSEFFYVDGTETVTMELFPAAAGLVTLTVTEQIGGAVIADATVVINDEDGNYVTTLTTNSSGLATTSELGFGRFYADLSKDGYLPNNDVPIWNDGGADVKTTLRKIETGPATVRVYNSDTNVNIANASIIVTETSTGDTQTITTDSDGVATFTASTGSYDFDVTADGYMDAHSSMTYSSSTTSVEIPMESREAGIATLTIRSLDGNNVLSGVDVVITNEAGNEVHTHTTGADGLVVTSELEGGVYSISMSKEGYADRTTSITITGNFSDDLFMDVLTSGTFTVLVADAQTSVPISGASVTIYQAEDVLPTTVMVGGMTQIRYIGSFGSVAASGTTLNGAFVSPELEPGFYIVWIEADGYQFESNQAFKLDRDIQESFNLNAGEPTSAPGDEDTGTTPDPGTDPGNNTDDDQTDPDDSGTNPGGSNDDSSDDGDDSETDNNGDDEGDSGTGDISDDSDADDSADNGNNDDDENTAGQLGTLNVGFALCADEDCANMDTSFDGYTVTWTVTPQQTTATDEVDANKIAAIGMVSEPVSFAVMQQAQSFTISGVIQDGMAVGTSEPVMVGTYSVCLNPVITGPDDDTSTIASDAVCSDVEVTASGNILQPFSGMAGSVTAGEPTDVDGENPSSESPSVPSNDAVAQSDSSASDGQAGTSDDSVTDLPNTGAGSAQGTNNGMLIASLLVLSLTMIQFGIRRRGSRA